jgi:hypothetical protein
VDTGWGEENVKTKGWSLDSDSIRTEEARHYVRELARCLRADFVGDLTFCTIEPCAESSTGIPSSCPRIGNSASSAINLADPPCA